MKGRFPMLVKRTLKTKVALATVALLIAGTSAASAKGKHARAHYRDYGAYAQVRGPFLMAPRGYARGTSVWVNGKRVGADPDRFIRNEIRREQESDLTSE